MAGHFLPGYFSVYVCWSGVDLFFVLSGFFISGILFREFLNVGNISTGRFLIRRGLKIWPLFYTALFMQWIYYTVKGSPITLHQFFNEFLFIQNYFPGFMGITWSLGNEEQFYILLALMLPFLLKNNTPNKILIFCMALLFICVGLRLAGYNGNAAPFYPFKYFYPTHLRADSLAAGIIISYFYHFNKTRFEQFVLKYRYLLWAIGVLLLVPLFIFPYYHPFTYTWGFSCNYLAYGILITLLLFPNTNYPSIFNRVLLNPIAWVGFYSYAIYLFHVFIGFGLVSQYRKLSGVSGPLWLEFALFMGGNILFGYLMSQFIEQPVLRWRDKQFPSNNQKIR